MMIKNEKGFTLVEMLIVMLVVSILLIITIPNVAKTNEKIQAKGCDAYIQMVQSQVQLYELQENKKVNGFSVLVPDYLPKENNTCPNGEPLVIVDSVVKLKNPKQDPPPDDGDDPDNGMGSE